MIGRIIRKEILSNLSSPTFLITCLFCSGLILLSIYTGLRSFSDQVSEYRQTEALNRQILGEQVFLWPNVGGMSRVIYDGELDDLLLRPISTQALLSLRSISFPAALHGAIGIFIIVYALEQLQIVPGILTILAAAVMLLSGVVIVYSLWFISMTLEFWFAGLWSWMSFIPNLFDFAKYPEGIFTGVVRFLFLTIAPVIVVANFPTQTLLGELPWINALWSLVLAGCLLILSQLQWRFAVRRYTSVGS